jgi:hypothetical protein
VSRDRLTASEAISMLVACLMIAASATGLAVLAGGCAFEVASNGGVGDPNGPDARPELDAATLTNDATTTPDAPPVIVTLRETGDDVIAPNTGTSCTAPGGATTRDGAWYRVFRPSAMGVSGTFAITFVSFYAAHATNVHGVQVKIGTYTGTLGGATITTSGISWLETTTIDVADTTAPLRVRVGNATASQILGAGVTFIVAIVAPNLSGVGDLHLGSTSSAESLPGYFGSSACGTAPPQTTESLGASGHVVIDVEGYAS